MFQQKIGNSAIVFCLFLLPSAIVQNRLSVLRCPKKVGASQEWAISKLVCSFSHTVRDHLSKMKNKIIHPWSYCFYKPDFTKFSALLIQMKSAELVRSSVGPVGGCRGQETTLLEKRRHQNCNCKLTAANKRLVQMSGPALWVSVPTTRDVELFG